MDAKEGLRIRIRHRKRSGKRVETVFGDYLDRARKHRLRGKRNNRNNRVFGDDDPDEDSEERKMVDTREIEPDESKIIVTTHTIERYLERMRDVSLSTRDAVLAIRGAVLRGRRSDREPTVMREIRPWLAVAKLSHCGRSVTIFLDDFSKLAVLVVVDANDSERLVTLTCFVAREDEREESGNQFGGVAEEAVLRAGSDHGRAVVAGDASDRRDGETPKTLPDMQRDGIDPDYVDRDPDEMHGLWWLWLLGT